MAMILIGGSCNIVDLPDALAGRIASIVAAEHGVLIGDAPGADTEVQALLVGHGYEHVGVFCAGDEPRNNLGDWAIYTVPPPQGAHGFAIQADKDREMVRRADYGLMIWNGTSPGTVLNVLRLALAEKPCVTYDVANGLVTTIRKVADWRTMLSRADPEIWDLLATRMTPDERLATTLA
ncbi:MAG: hypothetical protein EOR30_25975 [Mesorhizobium sp.]|uniref:hypothetical protein n=1 Tax=Mesorhizobium sp. TaxID=1871066 RepID=UPI000FE77774|nr:hypothetical protein [Mesorhizobium sp.]RWI37032.1 MAG: hypothetical protein EOR14_25785 [Mesorhizobium sp.]RWI63254.1 MAG: hypothetical protein EOR17_29255 [Mesorhizobium sp.]RWI82528.1 MAG: hypothetical protein EOR20_26910 [Mesorhizobium sp.]RWJ46705.1 MAG: hypothetical protein EOR30_25975 [Mesorhizobium sp.]RWJ57524.1 MAG: hypothetical protein EOR32_29545 [Mesorhizobium sp.]